MCKFVKNLKCHLALTDGTSDLVDDQAFYQYFVPNGTLQTITS